MSIGIIDVLTSTIALLIMAVPGYIIKKAKIVDEKAEKGFSIFVLYVAQAFLVFMSFLNSTYTPEIGKNMLVTAGLTTAIYILIIFIIKLFSVKDKEKTVIFRYGSIFGNVGFMGIPFLQMLFANQPCVNEVLIYAGVSVVIFNIVNWTVGIYMMSGDKKEISLKKILLNPVIVSAILGCIIFVIIKKPINEIGQSGSALNKFLSKIASSFDSIKGTVTPLSMAVIGMKLADMKAKDIFLDKHSYLVCLVKLVFVPVLAMLVVSFINVSAVLKYTVYLTMSMPCATSTTLFAVKFNRKSEFASSTVLLATILSSLTIPLTFVIFTNVFGVVI